MAAACCNLLQLAQNAIFSEKDTAHSFHSNAQMQFYCSFNVLWHEEFHKMTQHVLVSALQVAGLGGMGAGAGSAGGAGLGSMGCTGAGGACLGGMGVGGDACFSLACVSRDAACFVDELSAP